MKKLVIVSATSFEIAPLLTLLGIDVNKTSGFLISSVYKNVEIKVLITGVGMTNTAFALGMLKDTAFDAIINAGVAGSFNETLKTGDVVNVVNDCFSEMGAESADTFLTLSEINLGNENVKNENVLSNLASDKLKKVSGITVNTVHGNETSIAKIKKRLNPDVETMEGAAFLTSCKIFNRPTLQLRAISNKVETRNKDNWNMPLAIESLNQVLKNVLDNL